MQTKTPDTAQALANKKPRYRPGCRAGVGGPPSTYTVEVFQTICDRVHAGETLTAVCRDPDLPSRTTVRKWMSQNPETDAMFAWAREGLHDSWAEEIIGIADDGTTDYITKTGRNGHEYEAVDQDHIQRSRLRVDSRKWLLSKLRPGQYGDHVEVQHTGAVTVTHDLSDRERMRRMALFLLEDRAAGAVIEGKASPVAGDGGSPQATTPAKQPKSK